MRFDVTASFSRIDKITAKVHIRALSHALIDDLVASGDLAPGAIGPITTLELLGTQSTWTRATKGTGPALNSNCNPQ